MNKWGKKKVERSREEKQMELLWSRAEPLVPSSRWKELLPAHLYYLFTVNSRGSQAGSKSVWFKPKLFTHTFTSLPVVSGLQTFTDCFVEIRTQGSLGLFTQIHSHTAMVPWVCSVQVITYFHFTKSTVTTALLFFIQSSLLKNNLRCCFYQLHPRKKIQLTSSATPLLYIDT